MEVIRLQCTSNPNPAIYAQFLSDMCNASFIMFNSIFVLADQIEDLARHMSFQEWKTLQLW